MNTALLDLGYKTMIIIKTALALQYKFVEPNNKKDPAVIEKEYFELIESLVKKQEEHQAEVDPIFLSFAEICHAKIK